MKLDEAQVAEQEELRTKLQQEEDLLKEYQQKLLSDLKEQLQKEKDTLGARVRQREEQLKQRVRTTKIVICQVFVLFIVLILGV